MRPFLRKRYIDNPRPIHVNLGGGRKRKELSVSAVSDRLIMAGSVNGLEPSGLLGVMRRLEDDEPLRCGKYEVVVSLPPAEVRNHIPHRQLLAFARSHGIKLCRDRANGLVTDLMRTHACDRSCPMDF